MTKQEYEKLQIWNMLHDIENLYENRSRVKYIVRTVEQLYPEIADQIGQPYIKDFVEAVIMQDNRLIKKDFPDFYSAYREWVRSGY